MLNASTRLSSSTSRLKPIGSYLEDAGLLNSDQIKVILVDQQATGMRFGEIAVARGWVKEQTIEWIMRKVIAPERRSKQQDDRPPHCFVDTAKVAPADTLKQQATVRQPYLHKSLLITKPLPSVKSADSDVNWVG
jgi:hypothetical protein